MALTLTRAPYVERSQSGRHLMIRAQMREQTGAADESD